MKTYCSDWYWYGSVLVRYGSVLGRFSTGTGMIRFSTGTATAMYWYWYGSILVCQHEENTIPNLYWEAKVGSKAKLDHWLQSKVYICAMKNSYCRREIVKYRGMQRCSRELTLMIISFSASFYLLFFLFKFLTHRP